MLYKNVELVNAHYMDGLAKKEKIGSARVFFKVAQKIAPTKTLVAESVSKYFRILDDVVDQSEYILPVRELLKEELEGITDKKPLTSLQEEYLADVLQGYPSPVQRRLKINFSRILRNLTIDSQMRLSQTPLAADILKGRGFMGFWPPLVSLSLGWTQIEPRPNRRMAKLINAWARWDTVTDLVEDLQHGLVLISHEDLIKGSLNFSPHQPLPAEKLQQYYQNKSGGIKKDLRENAPALFEVGLPVWIAGAVFLHLHYRAFQLSKPLTVPEDILFSPPKDALRKFCLNN